MYKTFMLYSQYFQIDYIKSKIISFKRSGLLKQNTRISLYWPTYMTMNLHERYVFHVLHYIFRSHILHFDKSGKFTCLRIDLTF